jgi:hypothetical protein
MTQFTDQNAKRSRSDPCTRRAVQRSTPEAKSRRNFKGEAALALVTALLLAACGGHPESGAPSRTNTSGPAGFTVYDNAFYTNVDLESAGATKSNIVYGGPLPDRSGKKDEAELPAEADYEQKVRDNLRNPGPVVLDIETLYLRGAQDVAQSHLEKLATLLAWAHHAAPGKAIGFYGLLEFVDPQYYPLARKLTDDAYFPSLYTDTISHSRWENILAKDAERAKAIDPNKPFYPYLSPQYVAQGHKLPQAGQFIPAADWTFELQTARKYANGVIIWSSNHSPVSTDQGWVNATQQFITNLA